MRRTYLLPGRGSSGSVRIGVAQAMRRWVGVRGKRAAARFEYTLGDMAQSEFFLSRRLRRWSIAWLAACAAACAAQPTVYFAPDPGAAQATVSGGAVTLGNADLQMTWKAADGRLRGETMRDLINGHSQPAPRSTFVLILREGRVLNSAEMRVTAGPTAGDLAPQTQASRWSEHLPGKVVSAEMEDAAQGFEPAPALV